MEKTLWLTFFGHPVVGITAFKSWYIGAMDWIGLCSVLRPRQHSIGYMGDGLYRSMNTLTAEIN